MNNEEIVAAQLRGMRLAPTNTKHTQMLRTNLNIKNFWSNSKLLLSHVFQELCIYKDTYLIRIHNKCKYTLVRIYTEPKSSGLGRNRYGTPEYSQSIINLKGAIFILI